MKELKNGIIELADRYQFFVFDIWGVVHDGTLAYPGAVEAISGLRALGKNICFLSNAPRRATKVATMLRQFGISSELYDFILTSGEATYLDFKDNQEKNFPNFSQNYFYIGPKKDIDLLDGLKYKRVDSAADANFVIATGFDDEHSILEEKLPELKDAIKHNLPLICVNPDLAVVKQNGHKMICAGVLGQEYKKMGGKVIYYGKPFDQVYHITCKLFKQLTQAEPNKKEMIAIGDGIETDTKGAADFGIDSVLITGGMLTNVVNNKHGIELAKLNSICSEYQIYPNYITKYC